MVEPPEPPPPPSPPPAETPPPVAPEPSPSAPATRAAGSDLIFLIAGAVFFVSTLLPWYRVTIGRVATTSVSAGDSAWGSGGLGVMAAVFGIIAVLGVLAVVTGSKVMSRQSAGLVALIFSAMALAFTFLRLVIRPRGSSAVEALSRGLVQISRGYGLWLGLIASIVMTVVAYQTYQRTAV